MSGGPVVGAATHIVGIFRVLAEVYQLLPYNLVGDIYLLAASGLGHEDMLQGSGYRPLCSFQT